MHEVSPPPQNQIFKDHRWKTSLCRAWRSSQAWRTSFRVCRTISPLRRSTLTTGPSNSFTRCWQFVSLVRLPFYSPFSFDNKSKICKERYYNHRNYFLFSGTVRVEWKECSSRQSGSFTALEGYKRSPKHCLTYLTKPMQTWHTFFSELTMF